MREKLTPLPSDRREGRAQLDAVSPGHRGEPLLHWNLEFITVV